MDDNRDLFLQRLKCLRADCVDTILDPSSIQGDIRNYDRHIERRKTLTEIIDLYLDLEKESRSTSLINSRFSGTTIVS